MLGCRWSSMFWTRGSPGSWRSDCLLQSDRQTGSKKWHETLRKLTPAGLKAQCEDKQKHPEEPPQVRLAPGHTTLPSLSVHLQGLVQWGSSRRPRTSPYRMPPLRSSAQGSVSTWLRAAEHTWRWIPRWINTSLLHSMLFKHFNAPLCCLTCQCLLN